MSYRHALVDVLDFLDYLLEDAPKFNEGDTQDDAYYCEGYETSLVRLRDHVMVLLVNPEE